jgi:xylan 1,4-beta-xylosidase
MTRRYAIVLSLLLATVACRAQTGVRIDVDLAKPTGRFTPIYSWFGYDESGYTTTYPSFNLRRSASTGNKHIP